MKHCLILIALFFLTPLVIPLFAKTKLTPVAMAYLNNLKVEAKKEDPSFQYFSVQKGQDLFQKEFMHSRKKKNRSCQTCHKKPTSTGRHERTGKVIQPLAPSANRKRFVKKSKINKWFKRNCKWVLERECTAKEKGDFLIWAFSL